MGRKCFDIAIALMNDYDVSFGLDFLGKTKWCLRPCYALWPMVYGRFQGSSPNEDIILLISGNI